VCAPHAQSCGQSQADQRPHARHQYSFLFVDEGLALRQQFGRRYHEQAASIFLYEMVYFAELSKNTSGFADNFGFVAYEDIVVSEK